MSFSFHVSDVINFVFTCMHIVTDLRLTFSPKYYWLLKGKINCTSDDRLTKSSPQVTPNHAPREVPAALLAASTGRRTAVGCSGPQAAQSNAREAQVGSGARGPA